MKISVFNKLMWLVAVVPFYVLIFLSFIYPAARIICLILAVLWAVIGYCIVKALPEQLGCLPAACASRANPLWAIFVSVIIPILLFVLFVLIGC